MGSGSRQVERALGRRAVRRGLTQPRPGADGPAMMLVPVLVVGSVMHNVPRTLVSAGRVIV